MVVGVTILLAQYWDLISGRIAYVFQPVDEPMRGAQRMIDDGLLEWTTPDMSLTTHVLPMANVGQAVVQRGPIWASRDELTLMLVDAVQTLDVRGDLKSAVHTKMTPSS